LHGRNAATWEAKGLSTSGERFNDLYAEDELRELSEKLKPVAARVKRLHVFFNSHDEDYKLVIFSLWERPWPRSLHACVDLSRAIPLPRGGFFTGSMACATPSGCRRSWPAE